MKFYLTLVRTTIIKKIKLTNVDEDVGKGGAYVLLIRIQTSIATVKINMETPQNTTL